MPWERFRLADATPAVDEPDDTTVDGQLDTRTEVPAATRKVSPTGLICFASTRYHAGRWLAGQTVEVAGGRGLVHLSHRGVLVATRDTRVEDEHKGLRRGAKTVVAADGVGGVGGTQGRLGGQRVLRGHQLPRRGRLSAPAGRSR